MSEVFIPIVFFVTMGVVIYYMLRFRHTERMAVIERDISETQLKYLMTRATRGEGVPVMARIGVMAMGIGLALLIGNFLGGENNGQITAGLIFLFPGIGLWVLYVRYEKGIKQAD